jgi:phosphoribosylglycinamide formyltransferase-1
VAVNLIVDFAEDRFGRTAADGARAAAEAGGYRLARTANIDERLAAWIDWTFAPSWWSAEARASDVWYALDARGEPCGFAAFGTRERRFRWLRGYADRAEVGIFGPYGVAPQHRGTGLGEALADLALASLRERGYSRALIPAVAPERLIAMYERRAGARIADTYSYDPSRRYRTIVLASGSGTNAQHVFERVAAETLPLDIRGVIANVRGAGVIERAAAAGVRADIVAWDRGSESRAAYDGRVIAAVAAAEPELVLLLGWMHLLPAAFIDRFADILNIHPAFLPFDPNDDAVVMPDGSMIPAFRGAHALRDALRAGVAWTGASVHRVTAAIDRGAVLVRTPMRLDGSRERDAVADRLRPVEHAAVAAAIRRWCFEREG